MSDIFNISLAKNLVKTRISSRESDTINIHGIGIKYYKQSHKPKAIIVHYDHSRKWGNSTRRLGRNRRIQIELKELALINRQELFNHPIMIWNLREQISTK
jgi:hypothetical protein